MLPAIFISHGSPMLCLTKHKASSFLKELPNSFEKPKYIIVVSAHWISKDLRILANEKPIKINDFYGFAQELYDLEYSPSNNLEKVEELIKLFTKNSIEIKKEYERGGYDHGVWAPLSLMYEDADIPVIQISLPVFYEATELLKIGEVLKKLRKEALIIGSGTMTHNLRDSIREVDAPPKEYAKIFRDWIVEKIEAGDVNSIEKFKEQAPNLASNHPTLDHFLPLLITLGASHSKRGEALNSIYMYGNQAMDTIIFKE